MVFSPERSSLFVPGSIRLGAVASGTSLTHTAIFNLLAPRCSHAGAGRPSFHSGGASLYHEDPRFVYLSRTIGRWNQVELWFTPDNGRTWTTRRLTDDSDHYSIRPVRPRGHSGSANRVLFSRGDETTKGFTDYRTRIHALDF